MIYLKDLKTGMKTKGKDLDTILKCGVDIENCVVIDETSFNREVEQ